MVDSLARFGELSMRGFRRLSDVRLSLRPLPVMIGANGTGKTLVLDVLSLLASSAQARLSSSISDLSGLANTLTYDRAEELRLEITMEVPGHEPLVETDLNSNDSKIGFKDGWIGRAGSYSRLEFAFGGVDLVIAAHYIALPVQQNG